MAEPLAAVDPDRDPASLPASLSDCLDAVSVGDTTGLAAVPALAPRLRERCPALGALLRSSSVQTALETFDRQDAEAVRQQTRLMREATISSSCLLATGVLSGVVLTMGALSFDTRYGFWLGLAILGLGATAALFSFIARDQGRVTRWLTSRGESALARLAVFQAIADQAAAAGPAVAMYGLAVIQRHLLDDQRRWLGRRAARHRKSSEWTSALGGLAVALAFIGGSGAIIASRLGGTAWIVLSGVVGAALAAHATARESLRRDRANAERYEKAQVALDGLAGRTDAIEARIAAGEPQALTAFTQAIADLLSAEHKQWLEGAAQTAAALSKLDDRLEQLSKERNEKGTADPAAGP